MTNDLENARRIYKQVNLFKQQILDAHITLLGAKIDSFDEIFANQSIRDLSSATYLLSKNAIELDQEWRGYYVARGGRIEDIQPVSSKSEEG